MADILCVLPVDAVTHLFHPGMTSTGHPWTFGRFLAIEVKSATGKVSPAQYAFAKTVTDAGGLCVLARSVDDVARALSLPTSGQP